MRFYWKASNFQQPKPSKQCQWLRRNLIFLFFSSLCRHFIRLNLKFDELKSAVGDHCSSAQWQSVIGRNVLMINEQRFNELKSENSVQLEQFEEQKHWKIFSFEIVH